MTVLSSEVLCDHGPYVQFVDLPRAYEVHADEWPDLRDHRDDVFFEFPICLIDLYCGVTRTFSIFDPDTDAQIHKPHELQELSARFLGLAQTIARLRGSDLGRELEVYRIYEGSSLDRPGKVFTGEDLRLDLMETAMFVAGRLARMARDSRVLYIASI